jgi:hypothetical protein
MSYLSANNHAFSAIGNLPTDMSGMKRSEIDGEEADNILQESA